MVRIEKENLIRKEEIFFGSNKKKKETITAQYQDWFEKSIAMVIVEYTGINMKDLDSIRSKIRESGGEFHVIKNTLAKRAFDAAGIQIGRRLSGKKYSCWLCVRRCSKHRQGFG